MIPCFILLIYSCGSKNESSSIDNSPPSVVSLNPIDGAIDIPTDAHISITFNKPDVPITFSVKYAGKYIDCTISASGTTYTLVPLSDLSAGTTYTVTVISSDSSGGQHTFTWSFTTAGPPTVIVLGCYVLPSSSFYVTFSELMDPSTINSSTVYVTESTTEGEMQVPVTIAGSGTTYTVTPQIFSSFVLITITTGVKNVAGDAMVANFTEKVPECGL